MSNKKIEAQEEKSTEQVEAEKLAIKKAQIYTDSVTSAALSIGDIHKHKIDVPALVDHLQKQVDAVLNGDISQVESILMTQVQTLNALFHRMLTKMMSDSFHSSIEMYSNIALRAQNQCRQTLAVLSDLKRPQQTTVVRQQNLAINQQVNNSTQPEDQRRISKPANELLGVTSEPVDSGAQIAPITANFEMETVEEVHWGEDG